MNWEPARSFVKDLRRIAAPKPAEPRDIHCAWPQCRERGTHAEGMLHYCAEHISGVAELRARSVARSTERERERQDIR